LIKKTGILGVFVTLLLITSLILAGCTSDDDGNGGTPSAPTLTTIGITPDSATVKSGETQTFNVEAFDQNGSSMGAKTADAEFSIDDDAGGSFTNNTYTAAAAGTWTVTASYQGKSDTASIEVPALTFADLHIPLEAITDAVEVDGQWVQFNLIAPYEPFLQILAGSWGSIVDEQWSIAQGDWDGTQAGYEALNDPASGGSPLQAVANGTGPFSLERWDPAIEIALVKNGDYWQPEANFERVIIKVVDEWTTRKLMLQAGDADSVYVPRAYISELDGVNGLTVYQDLPSLNIDSFFFQFDINPESQMVGTGQLDGDGIPLDFFTDLDARLGFTLAFDWETYLSDALLNEAVQANSPVIDGLSYYNADNPKHAMDLAAAETHLRAAWGGAVWENGFTLTLAYNAGNLTRKTACEILQNNLFSINPLFKINIQVMQWPTLLRGMYTGLLPMFQIGWAPDYPDAHNFMYPFMHSGGTFAGWQNYNNPAADALVAAGIAATDPAERQVIYDDLAQIYFDDAPGILLAQPLGRRYFRSWVDGFYYNPTLPSQLGNVYALDKSGSPSNDLFVYATIGGIDTLDPAYAYDTASGEAITMIYETLLFFDGESTTEFIPMLATEWTVSEDGMTYRFKIREGVTFHNGNTLTPEDVEYSFERGMVQDYGAGPQWMIFEPLLGLGSSRT
jgi:peptide/nickel transport system substrate-binding protein